MQKFTKKKLIYIVLFYWCLLLTSCQTMRFASDEVVQKERNFKNIEEFKLWFLYYYQDPRPQDIGSALLYMDKNGLLEEYPEVASMFFAEIFAENSSQVSEWVRTWSPHLTQKQMTVLIVSIWLTERKDLMPLGINLAKRFKGKKSDGFINALSHTQAKLANPLYSEITTLGQINMLWGGFSASGDEKYVDRVLSLLGALGDKNEKDKKTLGEFAMISLAQNTLLHPKVAKIVLNAEKNHPDPITRALIQIMIEALATMEGAGDGEIDRRQKRERT